MTPPTLPTTSHELSALIAAAWPGCAAGAGVIDVFQVTLRPHAEGWLDVSEKWGRNKPAVLARAVASLADALEDLHCLAIDRSGSTPRVLGWAAARALLVLDINDPAANMYGCLPCPKCGEVYMYPPNLSKTGGKLRARCDDCGHEEDAEEAGAEAPRLVRIIDLEPRDPRRLAFDGPAFDARQARAEAARAPVGAPGSVDAKREHGREQWRAAYGRR